MGWGDAVAAVFGTVNKVLGRIWGDQTSSEASLQKRAEEAAKKKREALANMKEAQRAGDAITTAAYQSAANGWAAELRRLSDEAAAKRLP